VAQAPVQHVLRDDLESESEPTHRDDVFLWGLPPISRAHRGRRKIRKSPERRGQAAEQAHGLFAARAGAPSCART